MYFYIVSIYVKRMLEVEVQLKTVQIWKWWGKELSFALAILFSHLDYLTTYLDLHFSQGQ